MVVGVNYAEAAAPAVQINQQIVVLPLLGRVLVHVCAHAPLPARALRYELHLQDPQQYASVH